MPPFFGSPGSPRRRYESKASQLNSKLESDYKDCLDVLEREKQNPSNQTSCDMNMSITDVPTLISAPKDPAIRQEMLRRTKTTNTNSTSQSTTTQKMFMASEENGIVITSNRRVNKTPTTKNNSSTGTGGDASTLPTFLSVGASVSWQHDHQDTNKLYLVSKESIEESPLLTPVSLVSPRSSSPTTEKETRKRLQYKEKLRLLAERLTTSSAVERSRKMLSDIRENGLIERNETPNVSNGGDINNNNSNSNTPPEAQDKGSSNNTPYKRIYDGIKKNLYACSMRMCVDDSVVDHEGLIIAVPRCRCTEDMMNSTEDDEHPDFYGEDNNSAVSSLTGMTPYRFQARYWMDKPESNGNEMLWI